MADKKTLIIIDDHPPFRESTIRLLEGCEEFAVIGSAGDAREGEKIAMAQKPDLAIVDLSLPDKSGIDLTHALKTLLPEMRIVIVSKHDRINYVIAALAAGALAYVVKDSGALKEGLEAAVNGEYYLDPALSGEIAGKLITVAQEEKCTNSSYGSLSPREQEVLRLLAQGITTKAIAEKLFISAKTVANHRANIMAKLDLHTTAQLVHYAAQLGLLGLIR